MSDTTIRTFDLVCLGSLIVDLVGQTADDVEHTTTYERVLGGACTNVASTAARLGCSTVAIGRVGDDAFGRFTRSELRRFGIADYLLQVDPERASSVIFLPQTLKRDDFVLVRGADHMLTLDDETRSTIRAARALHTTTFALSWEPSRSATIEAIEIAHAAGRIVSLDPNFRSRVWSNDAELLPLFRRLLPLTTVIKPSLRDAEAIWGAGKTPGDYIELFHANGARQVMLTLGRDGVVVSDGRTVQRVPAVPIAGASTGGLGDAFTAAAITALLNGESLVGAARLGTLVASLRLRNGDRAAPLPALPILIQQIRAGDDIFPAVSMRN